MPLNDFIKEPIAHDIVHNGATFQVSVVHIQSEYVVVLNFYLI